MQKTIFYSALMITVALVGIIVAFNVGGDANVGATVVTNIPLAQGEIMVGNSLGYAEEGGNSGAITGQYAVAEPVTAVTATTTLTSANAGTILLGASSDQETITLPAVSAGLKLTFTITGALTGPSVVIDSAEGDNIEGALRVNDALVACSGEDQINIITDGEVIGDMIEIISDGTSWYITDSEVEASAKATCTDPS